MDLVRLALTLVVSIAAYVWMSVALGAVFAKVGEKPSVAWIPIARYVSAARAAELPTLAVWIARGVAVGAWLLVLTAAIAELGALAAAAAPFAIAATVFAWGLWIIGANRIELRLVAERRLWWVAALVPALWATIVGFGPARPVVDGPVVGMVPEPELEEDDATRAIERVQVPVKDSEDLSDESHPVEEVSMTTDDYDVTGKFPRAYSPYDRMPDPVGMPPASPEPPAPASAPVALPWDYDDDETFFAKRRRARWVLKVVGGEEYDLDDVTTIGREGIRPIPGVLPIVDDTRTMSKLHARLRRESDSWFITDLGSTNGTFVRDAAGTEFEVKAQSEAKVDGTLLLGDLEVIIVDHRGAA